MKGLIVVVNFNQEKEIAKFLTELTSQNTSEDILLVDDGSSDSSLEKAKPFNTRIIQHDQNEGVGSAIRSGINFAHNNDYHYVVIMSANGKMLVSDLKNITTPLLTGISDYVTGTRYHSQVTSPGISLFRKLSIPIFSKICSLFLGKSFSDITCGYRAYKVDFLLSSPIDIQQSWLNRYEMEYYIHYYAVKKNLTIKEIPVTIRYDHLESGRKSKIIPFVDWWKMIYPIIALRLGLKK